MLIAGEPIDSSAVLASADMSDVLAADVDKVLSGQPANRNIIDPNKIPFTTGEVAVNKYVSLVVLVESLKTFARHSGGCND